MRPDDLPLYPTPQQATYTVPPQTQPARRPRPAQLLSLPPQPTPAQYSAPQHTYQQRQPLYPQPQPQHQPQHAPQQQYYQQPAQQPQYLYLNHYQQAPPQQYYQSPPPVVQHQPPSATSSHYASSPLYAQTQYLGQPQYQPPPPQKSQRHGLLSLPAVAPAPTPQYTAHAPAPAPVPVLQPARLTPSKKPPQASNRSRESLEDKLTSKQRLESELRATFEKVDKNRSGRISARELSSALMNFDNTRFQPSTVLLMIKLFTTSSSPGGLNFEQFVSLWKYLTAYKKLFVAADVNRSGDISFGEFQRIIEEIGYKLNVDLVLHLFQKFANNESPDSGSAIVSNLKFDAFIELLVYLRTLTDVFKQYDKDLSGVATINYLDFLRELSNLT